MVEQPVSPEQDAIIHRLYVRRMSRLSFEVPQGELKDALLGMFNPRVREQMGQRALLLYSEDQTREYRPASKEAHAAELLDSTVTKRIKHLKSKQYKPARWVDAVRSVHEPATLFRLNILLDPTTQEQLHASIREGLDQTKFGKRAITAALRVPDAEIVDTPRERRAASRAIRDALWADDDQSVSLNLLIVATGQKNIVTNIDWSSRLLQ